MGITRRTITRNRAKLLAAVEKPEVITGISLSNNGAINISTCNWKKYWEPVFSLNNAELTAAVESLHIIWNQYILSRFKPSFHRDYCYLYYSLIQKALDLSPEFSKPGPLEIISRIAAFENFNIRLDSSQGLACAACTTTTRNPNYLLGKLKNPNAPEDPQLLPLITIHDAPSEMYYHYRQHKLSIDSNSSLLLYPAANHANRPDSFSAISKLESAISSGADPWAGKRAQTFVKGLLPFLSNIFQTVDKAHAIIELVDLGSGSGSLLACLCDELSKLLDSNGIKCGFRIWMIDIAPISPEKEFAKLKRRGILDSVTCLSVDYKKWLAKPQPLPKKHGLRAIIISRFFNNLSDFIIAPFEYEKFKQDLSFSEPANHQASYNPVVCLVPDGKGPENLVTSSKHLDLGNGQSFNQFSLSNYFRCLYLLQNKPGSEAEMKVGSVYLPVRSFRPDSLIADNGDSILESLLESCDAIALQDADLTPEVLQSHLANFCKTKIDVSDLTREVGLQRHYFYLITRDKQESRQGGLA